MTRTADQVTADYARLMALLAEHDRAWSPTGDFVTEAWRSFYSRAMNDLQLQTPAGQPKRWDLREIDAQVSQVATELEEFRKAARALGLPLPTARPGRPSRVAGFAPFGVSAYPSAMELDPTQVGHWFLPLALGVPAGAAGGYYYRKWQEAHPGKWLPWVSGDPDAGHARSWPRTRALIRSAIREVQEDRQGAPAYVWSLEASGDTNVVPFESLAAARDHMIERIHTEHVALAVFDRGSHHWPNPTNWTKDSSPEHEGAIDQQIARYAAPSASSRVGAMPWYDIVGGCPPGVGAQPWYDIVGSQPWYDIVGSQPWYTIVGEAIVGEALDVLRRQGKIAAEELPARVVGVLQGAGNKWTLKQFRSADDADDWFGRVTSSPSTFAYAAYFDKADPLFPVPLNEAIGQVGGQKALPSPRPSIRRGIAEAR